jgi:hypothetical protein
MWKCQLGCRTLTWPAEIAIYVHARARLKYISRDDAPCESPDEYVYRLSPPPPPPHLLRASRRGFIFRRNSQSRSD